MIVNRYHTYGSLDFSVIFYVLLKYKSNFILLNCIYVIVETQILISYLKKFQLIISRAILKNITFRLEKRSEKRFIDIPAETCRNHSQENNLNQMEILRFSSVFFPRMF